MEEMVVNMEEAILEEVLFKEFMLQVLATSVNMQEVIAQEVMVEVMSSSVAMVEDIITEEFSLNIEKCEIYVNN